MTHASQTEPGPHDEPFNAATSVTLDPNTQQTVVLVPDDHHEARHFLETLAISKKRDTTYTVDKDSQEEFPEAGIPPTDIDDATDTYRPPLTFEDRIEVTIANLDGSKTRTYYVQAIGWKRRKRGGY